MFTGSIGVENKKMKLDKIKIIGTVLLVLTVLAGCQKEIDITILPPPEDAFTANTTTAELVKHTVRHDGSFDNILDKTSCSSLVLPVEVIVNGIEVTISTIDDLITVEEILDEDSNNEDEVEIIFPVTILLADYTQQLISNEDELEAIQDACTEGGDDDDIECIDFVYPIKITVYDLQNQLSKVITINDDSALHNFIETLEDELISFSFPLMMRLTDGTEITLSNNKEVEDSIEDAIGDCDEDDDNDYDDDDVDDNTLISFLTDGSWKVSSFIEENENETSHFTNYVFTFNNDGTVLSSNGTNDVSGTWRTNGDGGVIVLKLNFGATEPFDEISEDWKVAEYTASNIKLVDDINKPTPERALIFEKL